MEEGWVLDGTIAQDSAQVAGIWGLREGISVALKHAGALLQPDVYHSPLRFIFTWLVPACR